MRLTFHVRHRLRFPALLAASCSLLALGCHTQELEQLRLHSVPPELRDTVKSLDLGRRDIREYWFEVDKQTALLIIDPVLQGWFRYHSDDHWTLEYRPSDFRVFDNTQRIVIVQVMPVMSFFDVLSERATPAKWRPVDKVGLRRGTEIQESTEVNRGPLKSPTEQSYYNAGFYGFDPDGFMPGETVELIVWRGDESVVIGVPETLRLQIREHISIFDNVFADET